ncbi:MAG: AraC family transcriptional regulator [Acidobacteriota bacterium]|nr:AraC family transcriptional regulator [Acidobacteriota bacterium]
MDRTEVGPMPRLVPDGRTPSETPGIVQDDVSHDASGIPLYVGFEGDATHGYHDVLGHWHEGVELVRVLEGEVDLQVNDASHHLSPGDVCFVNRHQLHLVSSSGSAGSRSCVVVIDPSLLTRNQEIYDAYIAPLLEDDAFTHLHSPQGRGMTAELCQIIDEMSHLQQTRPPAYELLLVAHVHLLFQRLFLARASAGERAQRTDADLRSQRRMASYVYEHFSERVTLDDIAAAGGVSRSKATKMFNRYLGQPPVAFLNKYRLEMGCRLLRDSDEPISRIAHSCGFSQPSYFNRLFLREYGCTPSQYRARSRRDGR